MDKPKVIITGAGSRLDAKLAAAMVFSGVSISHVRDIEDIPDYIPHVLDVPKRSRGKGKTKKDWEK